MSSTPEAGSLVLRDDLPLPDADDTRSEEVPDGATVLVAVPADPGDPTPVAAAVLTGSVPVLFLEHLWVRPDRTDDARAVGELVRAHARAAGATVLELDVATDDAVGAVVAEGTRLLGQRLTEPVPPETEVPAGFGWRAMTEGEFDAWRERQVELYARDGLQNFGGDLELALADATQDFADLLPDGLATPDTSLLVLTVEETRVGHLWVRHHARPGWSFVFDVEVDEAHRGRGHGRSAMRVAERLARSAGDDVLGLHVFGWNVVARSLYRSLGYTLLSSSHDLLAPA